MLAKGRIDWIDRLRGLAFYLVIVGHMAPNNTFDKWIFSFHMPLFFIVSGFNFDIGKTLSTKFSDYVGHLAKRILVPYFWLMTGTIISKYLIKYSSADGGFVPEYLLGALLGNNRILTFASTPMYFLLLLFLAKVALWFIVRLARGRKDLMLIMIAPLAAISILTESEPMVWHINVVPTALLFMYIGMFFIDLYRQNKAKLRKVPTYKYLFVCAFLFAAGFVIQYFNGRTSVNRNDFGEDYMLYVVSAVLSTVAFTLLVIRMPKMRIVSLVGQSTVFLLGIHEPIMHPIKAIFPDYYEEPWFILIFSLIFYLAPLPLAWLVNRYAPYLNGLSLKKITRATKIAQIIVVAFALLPVYLSAVRFSFDGKMLESPVSIALSLVAYISVVIMVEWFFDAKLPVMFCHKLTKGKSK